MAQRRTPGVSALLVLALSLAACGDDEPAGSQGGAGAGGDGGGTGATGGASASGGASAAGGSGGDGASGGSAATTGSGGDGATGGTGGSSGAATTGGTGGSGLGGEGGAPDGEGGAGASPLLYANVVAVEVSGSDGAYTFNVSVESTDIDCSQYADWWEVLAEDGSLVYRRILEHSHTDENGTSDANAPGNTFTRSGGPVPVAAGDAVYVRAHLSVGGYNGAVMQGMPSGTFAEALGLAPDFAQAVEDEPPQPGECLF